MPSGYWWITATSWCTFFRKNRASITTWNGYGATHGPSNGDIFVNWRLSVKKLIGIFALAGISAFGAEITGFVGDASCGAKHKDASDASAACAKRCTGRGDQAVLVTPEGKVYKIDSGSQT